MIRISLLMSTRTILSGLGALIIPLVCYVSTCIAENKHKNRIQKCILILYILGILYLTLGRSAEPERRQINLTPFWSYALASDPQYRWQIYMNVFLFIPFGFMLPWVTNRNSVQTILLGFLLSVIIEALQFFFGLGMCEFDDVFHNTLGTALGYLYWNVLNKHGYRLVQFLKQKIDKLKSK